MCGRFTLTSDIDLLLYRFSAILMSDLKYTPNYNIAPTQTILGVVKEAGNTVLKPFTWGLIPFWSKDSKIGVKMINARSETLTQKPSFRNLLPNRRCLIPANGFYEWMKIPRAKQPYYIKPKKDKLFSFAGLWDSWSAPSGETIHSCTIITTEANDLIKPIHKRMPVILSPEQEHIWLDQNITKNALLLPLLKPFPSKLLSMYKVSPIVNSPSNNAPECIIPIE